MSFFVHTKYMVDCGQGIACCGFWITVVYMNWTSECVWDVYAFGLCGGGFLFMPGVLPMSGMI